MDTEEFEQIPWSQLLPQADQSKQRILYIAAGVVVALVVGVIAARSIGGPEPTVVSLPAEPASSTTIAPVVEAAVTTESIPGSAAEPTPLSEADLMAVLPEEETRAAAAAAERFVTDYFTVDGGAGSHERVAATVPDIVDALLPHGLSPDGLSYVEWARSTRIEPSGPRSYEVTVNYGTVASRGGGPIVRQPVKTVVVTVRFTDLGTPRMVGLPRPQTTPELSEAGITSEQAPEFVVAAAVTKAAAVGDAPQVAGAYRIAGGWHVVVVVQDPASGIGWPLAFVVVE